MERASKSTTRVPPSPARTTAPFLRSSRGGGGVWEGVRQYGLVAAAIIGISLMVVWVVVWQNNSLGSSSSDLLLGLTTTNSVAVASSPGGTSNVYSSLRNDNQQKVEYAAVPGWNRENPLGIPQGQAQNLPSIRVEAKNHQENVDQRRQIYGGVGDKAHLGGFTELDLAGVSPTTWRHMIEDFNIHSLLDVGCGRGISTSWFDDHGVDVLCVEGSHDAFQQSVLDNPQTKMVEHDFSRGPWWPAKTYDAVWSVEFLEHVGLNYHFNYISTFRKAALLFVTSSRWGGWHHVEVHQDDWWVLKYESYGFRYSESLTKKVRDWASSEKGKMQAPNGELYNAQHIWLTMKVFINPVVAALPEHAHLFYKHGCFVKIGEPGRPCGVGNGQEAKLESKMPAEFMPIALTPEMDAKWENRIKQNVKQKTVQS